MARGENEGQQREKRFETSHPSSRPATSGSFNMADYSDWLRPPFPQPPHYPNGQQSSQNFHFVGVPMNYAPFSPPPQAPCSKGTPSPSMHASAKRATPSKVVPQENETINIDADEDNVQHVRTEKRLNWTKEEDVRLVSAWLNNSNNPIEGNDKKFDQYWAEVTDVYNSQTESHRKREANQLKLHWQRIKTPVNNFNGCYKSVSAVYSSGMNDYQMINKALEKYEADYGKPFTMMHWWTVLKDEPKWCAYTSYLSKEKRKASADSPHDVEAKDIPRPIGCKAAKAERNGKRKTPEAFTMMNEKLDKFIDSIRSVRQDRDKVSDVQQRLSADKVEASRPEHLTDMEHNKTKMLDVYRDLLFAPTNGLDDDAKAERAKALESMRFILFSKEN